MAGFALRAPVYRPWVGPARGWAAAAWFGAAVFACLAGSAPAANRPDDNDRYADRLGELVNRYREQSGGKPLALDGSLAALARQHSAAMAKAGSLSHDGFPSRFRRSGYGMCIENIGWNYLTPQAQLLAWQRSTTTISAGRARRGRIILLVADGMPISDVAATVGISRRFVYKWVQRFLEKGLVGLTDKPGRGYRRVSPTPALAEPHAVSV